MIKFLDLQKINARFHDQFQQKTKSVLDSGWFILGNEVKTFETNFATYCGAKHCIGVGNGLDALVLILKAHIQLNNLQKGDEVIVPSNTYIATILAILQADLVPVLVEPNLETYNINPNLIEAKITPKTKAIMPVHLYGQLCEMDKINAIAEKYNLVVIEDAAQAQGVAGYGFRVSSLQISDSSLQITDYRLQNSDSRLQNSDSHFTNSQLATRNSIAFSFYPGKNLGALGDGGAIVTNNDNLAQVLYAMRNYGSEKKYYNEFIGINSRLDELQAAFLNVKLPFLDADNSRRQAIAKRYCNEIKNEKIILPIFSSQDTMPSHVFHLFVIRTSNRNELQDFLIQNGIETLIHYPITPHQQKAFKEWNNESFPIAEKIHNEVLSLPMSPVLTDEEVSFIVEVLNRY